jgi:hypothetical protein
LALLAGVALRELFVGSPLSPPLLASLPQVHPLEALGVPLSSNGDCVQTLADALPALSSLAELTLALPAAVTTVRIPTLISFASCLWP